MGGGELAKQRYLDPSRISDSGEACLATISRLYGDHETGLLSSESLVISCASAVEAHFDRVLNELIKRNGPASNLSSGSNQLFAALLDDVRDDMFRTWEARLSWLKRGFGISIAGDAETQNYRLVIELRNSLIHGNGHMTDSQIRDFRRACELRRQMALHLDVQFNGRVVLLMAFTGIKAVELSREMIRHLDNSLAPVTVAR
jgi:hypothetical protein